MVIEELLELCGNQAAVLDALFTLAEAKRQNCEHVQLLKSVRDLAPCARLFLIQRDASDQGLSLRAIARLEASTHTTQYQASRCSVRVDELAGVPSDLLYRAYDQRLMQDEHDDTRSALVIPLVADDQVTGLLFLEAPQPLSESALEKLMLFSSQVGVYVDAQHAPPGAVPAHVSTSTPQPPASEASRSQAALETRIEELELALSHLSKGLVVLEAHTLAVCSSTKAFTQRFGNVASGSSFVDYLKEHDPCSANRLHKALAEHAPIKAPPASSPNGNLKQAFHGAPNDWKTFLEALPPTVCLDKTRLSVQYRLLPAESPKILMLLDSEVVEDTANDQEDS